MEFSDFLLQVKVLVSHHQIPTTSTRIIYTDQITTERNCIHVSFFFILIDILDKTSTLKKSFAILSLLLDNFINFFYGILALSDASEGTSRHHQLSISTTSTRTGNYCYTSFEEYNKCKQYVFIILNYYSLVIMVY